MKLRSHLALSLVLSACAADHRTFTVNDDDYPGIGQAHFAVLSGGCTVTAQGMTASIANGETALVALSPTDGKVTLNATQSDTSPCEMASTLKLTLSAADTGTHGVFLDYSNGLFCTATLAQGPLVVLDLGTGSNDTLTIRGSANIDKFYLGRGPVGGPAYLNVNGGTTVGFDAAPDVSFANVENVVVSTGAGADIIDGSSVQFGTVAPFPNALQLFGGAGNDNITGGAGDDIISGDSEDDTLVGGAGRNTFKMGAAADGSDQIDIGSVNTNGTDTVDYSQRTANLTIVMDGATASGDTGAGEADKIDDKVAVVLGGSGNDSITVKPASTLRHTLKGGPGNDTLTGSTSSGTGVDTLIGGDGSANTADGNDVFVGPRATVDYSARSASLTIRIDQNGVLTSGDISTASPHVYQNGTSSAAAAPSGGSATITGLSNMYTGLVGQDFVVAATTGGTDNGTYPILSVPSATSITIDTSSNGSFVADAALGAWTVVQHTATAEADKVECPHVIGAQQGSAVNTITGDAQNNFITGGPNNDTLIGGAGSDTLYGLGGGDTLYGGAGDDTLVGGAGNDTLVGGDGSDVLEGDDGTDSFQCDGKNDASTAGSLPSLSDFVVDYLSSGPDNDTRVIPNDCEY